MAREYDATQTNILSQTRIIDVPCTLACWFYALAPGDQTVLGVSESADYADLMILVQRDTDYVSALVSNDGGDVNYEIADSPLSIIGDIWYHIAAVFANDSYRICYLDGSPGTANTNTLGLTSGIDNATIGCLRTGGGFFTLLEGIVADAGFWNVALSAEEIAALAQGYSAEFIRPQNLQIYAPIIRGTPVDKMSGVAFTETGTPTDFVHDYGALYPAPPMGISYESAIAGGWTGKINGVTSPAAVNSVLAANIQSINAI